eukprot:TRINITY_DN26722_c0_g1_i2.p1 TRINITY_DN26722_c0_g1~~TRINITY_DN26722_c0_g1_i2.p1  ORF type:complete len:125 (+),score=24.95 TRINITY_DN26722_c0_g1_i2:214-588(+)
MEEWDRLHHRGAQLLNALATALADRGVDGSSTSAFTTTQALRKLLPLFQEQLARLGEERSARLTAWHDDPAAARVASARLESYCSEFDLKVHAIGQTGPDMAEELLTGIIIAWESSPFLPWPVP